MTHTLCFWYLQKFSLLLVKHVNQLGENTRDYTVGERAHTKSIQFKHLRLVDFEIYFNVNVNYIILNNTLSSNFEYNTWIRLGNTTQKNGVFHYGFLQ